MYSSKMKKTVCIMLLCLLTVACAITSACTGGANAIQDKTVSISAVFEQTDVVYEGASLETLKPMLTVNKVTQSGKTGTVARYILTGELVEGGCVITVILQGDRSITTTFTVLVTAEDHVHVYGDWYSVKRPTCVEEGKEERACACGSREERAIALVEHTPGVAVRENSISNTCTENGSYDMAVYCTVCNAELSREHHVVDATGHAPKAEVEENRVEPTCVNVGGYDTVIYCGNCKEELSREHHVIDAKGHSPKDAVEENRVHATCVKEGGYDTVVYCGVCKVELDRKHTVVDAKGHSPKDAVEENHSHPTCLKEGGYDTVVYCGVCKVELDRKHTVLDALGHEFSVLNGVHKPATCLENREDIFKCVRCKETEVREIENSAKGHSPKPAVEENQVDPTCVNAGGYDTVVYCGNCDAELDRKHTVLDALGHQTNGLKDCARCGVVAEVIVFEFGANGAASHDDGSDLGASKSYSQDGYTLALTAMSKVYGSARDAKGNSCIKLGTGKLVGTFTFTVPAEVNKVVINVAQYKENATKINVNGTVYVINTASNNGAYTAIEVDTTTNKKVVFTTVSGGIRAMVNSIEYHVEIEKSDATKLEEEVTKLPITANKSLEADYSITLPTAGKLYNGVEVSWQLSSTTGATLKNNVLTVERLIPQDNIATVHVVLSLNNETLEKSYDITVERYVKLTIAQFNTYASTFAHNKYSTNKYEITGTITSIVNTTYGNMYIEDENGDKAYIYGLYSADGSVRYDAMANKPVVGDTVTLSTVAGAYAEKPQGKSAWLINCVHEHDFTNGNCACGEKDPNAEEPEQPEEKVYTVAEMIAMANLYAHDTYSTDKYLVTGVISSIATTTYGNMNIKDATGEMLIYGTYSADGSTQYGSMANKPVVGDTVTILTVVGTYNSSPQGKNGWIVKQTAGHTCAYGEGWTANETHHFHACVYCGAANEESKVAHDFANGDCVCGASDPSALSEVVFEFGANGSASHVDGNDYGTSKTFTEGGVSLKLTSMSKVYGPAYDAKGNSCIKLGTGSVAGNFTFVVPEGVTEVKIAIAAYKANTATIDVNGTKTTLTKKSNNGEYDIITVDTTTNKTIVLKVSSGNRAMVNSITFKYSAQPEVPEHTCSFTALKSDATHHWYACECGEINGKVEHTAEYVIIDAESHKKVCSVCETLVEDATAHDFANGNCPCGQEAPGVENKESSLAITAKTGSLVEKSISWANSEIKFSNDQASSSNAIRTSDTDHYRVYAKSNVTISVANGTLSKIVITCTSSSYVTALVNSASAVDGVTASASGSVVTIEVTSSVSLITFTSTAQWRLKNITVTYLA